MSATWSQWFKTYLINRCCKMSKKLSQKIEICWVWSLTTVQHITEKLLASLYLRKQKLTLNWHNLNFYQKLCVINKWHKVLCEANNLLINWWNNRLGNVLSQIVLLVCLCSPAAIPPENTNWHYVAPHGMTYRQKFKSNLAFLKSMSHGLSNVIRIVQIGRYLGGSLK